MYVCREVYSSLLMNLKVVPFEEKFLLSTGKARQYFGTRPYPSTSITLRGFPKSWDMLTCKTSFLKIQIYHNSQSFTYLFYHMCPKVKPGQSKNKTACPASTRRNNSKFTQHSDNCR